VKYPKQKKVLLKVDWNISNLKDTNRIEASIPTLVELLESGSTVVIATHWGRPEGKRDSKYSTQKLVPVLGKILHDQGTDTEIVFVDQTANWEAARNTINSCGIKGGQIVMLENTRFLEDEQSTDIKKRTELAKKYAELVDIMVDEAFSLSHRHEATNSDIKLLVPHYFGREYLEEVEVLTALKTEPEKPFYVVMGGAKLETKLPLIEKLLPKADRIFIGGQLVFTFLAAKGEWAHDSTVEESFIPKAKKLLDKYGTKIVLADVEYANVGGKKLGVDVGVGFVHKVGVACKAGGTIFWNGCMGWVEKGYTSGTQSLAYTLATSDLYIVVGGGDTVASINPEILEAFDFVSMGGGATLEFLAT
jgi:phosphoglycerate kinase